MAKEPDRSKHLDGAADWNDIEGAGFDFDEEEAPENVNTQRSDNENETNETEKPKNQRKKRGANKNKKILNIEDNPRVKKALSTDIAKKGRVGFNIDPELYKEIILCMHHPNSRMKSLTMFGEEAIRLMLKRENEYYEKLAKVLGDDDL